MNSDNIYSTGHSWSRETMARDAAGFAAAEASVPTDFNGLARWMGYTPHLLRTAIGRATTRQTIIDRLNTAGIRFQNNDQFLADAYLSELAQEVAPVMDAAE